MLKATPPPVPPRVKLGRMTAGKPISFTTSRASVQVMGKAAAGDLQPDLPHGLLEELPVFRLADGLLVGADHLHPELFQDPHLGHLDGRVEAGLAAQGGEQRLRPFPLDDLGHDLGGDRLDVGPVRHLRVGHDRGRVGVDQDDFEPLFPQGLAGLGPGVVELAGLADDDGPGPDDEDFMDVRCAWALFLGVPLHEGDEFIEEIGGIVGPAEASGWYCTEKTGSRRWRIPSRLWSFRLMWVISTCPAGRVSRSTQNPWFWVVISTFPLGRFLTGWLAPRWPNFSL